MIAVDSDFFFLCWPACQWDWGDKSVPHAYRREKQSELLQWFLSLSPPAACPAPAYSAPSLRWHLHKIRRILRQSVQKNAQLGVRFSWSILWVRILITGHLLYFNTKLTQRNESNVTIGTTRNWARRWLIKLIILKSYFILGMLHIGILELLTHGYISNQILKTKDLFTHFHQVVNWKSSIKHDPDISI